MSINMSATNSTTSEGQFWTSSQILTSFGCFVVYLTNGFLLHLFQTRPTLRTPFGIYIIVIASANVIQFICINPLIIVIKDLLPVFSWSAFCSVYGYFGLVAGASTPIAHMLISLNRGWAISFPVHYKRHHSHKTAIVVSSTAILIICISAAPGITIDGLFHRTENLNIQCKLSSAQSVTTWITVMSACFFIAPECVIVLSYPFFVFRRVRYRRKIQTSHAADADGVDVTHHPTATHGEHVERVRMKTTSRSFLILTCLTVSVLLFWTPTNMFYLLIRYFNVAVLFHIGNAFKMVQAILDPVLFVIALKDLGSACVEILEEVGNLLVPAKAR